MDILPELNISGAPEATIICCLKGGMKSYSKFECLSLTYFHAIRLVGEDIIQEFGTYEDTVKSHFKALGLYNFKGVLGELINGELISG